MQNLALIENETEVEVQFRASVKELCIAASDALIMTRPDLSQATDLVKTIKNRSKEIEDERTKLVKPFNEGVKAINGRFKAMAAPLEEAETVLKGKMLTFQKEEERRTREEQERLAKIQREEEAKRRAEWEAKEKERLRMIAEEEAKRKASEDDSIRSMPMPEPEPEVYVPAPVVQAPVHKATTYGQTGAVSTVKKQWTFDLTDIKALAAARPDLVMVDTVKINAEIRGKGGNISGLKIYEKDIISVR